MNVLVIILIIFIVLLAMVGMGLFLLMSSAPTESSAPEESQEPAPVPAPAPAPAPTPQVGTAPVPPKSALDSFVLGSDKYGLAGNNDVAIIRDDRAKTSESCAKACLAKDKCRSFDHSADTNACFLSSKTIGDSGMSFNTGLPVGQFVYYERI